MKSYNVNIIMFYSMKYILVTFFYLISFFQIPSNQLQNVLRIKSKKNFQFVIVYNVALAIKQFLESSAVHHMYVNYYELMYTLFHLVSSFEGYMS